MGPSKNKPAQKDENPMKGYDPTDRNFQNTEDAPVASGQQEEEEEFDEYEEVDEDEEEEEEEDEDLIV